MGIPSHPQNQKYTTYCNIVIGNTYRKFHEVWTLRSLNMRVDTHTDYRQAYRSTTGGQSNKQNETNQITMRFSTPYRAPYAIFALTQPSWHIFGA